MTENESVLITLQNAIECATDNITREDLEMMVKCLEELQQYRAIGTVEELKTAMKYVSLAKKHGTVGMAIDACAEYESIGTIEEFKALKEKNEPKKVIVKGVMGFDGEEAYCCPTCGLDNAQWGCNRCVDCGQKLDWSE